MVEEPETLGINEAAALLGAHEQTVRRLARLGEIPAFKLGADWRFRREALLRWIEAQGARVRRPNALIVDDEAKVRKAVAAMVERAGCKAWLAASGRDGLDLVETCSPDVILLDLRMPDLNGPQFLERLRPTHPSVPVVVVTGYPDGKLMADAMKHAPVMLLAKPLEREALERTLKAILGERLVALR